MTGHPARNPVDLERVTLPDGPAPGAPYINPAASPNAPRPWPADREPEHGRYTTYVNYGCRCDACTADNTRSTREYRERRRR